jgi:putative redox protein
METIKTTYMGGLRTEATHLQSGNKIITDAPTDNNGKGEAFSPTDLLAASLGSCALTIMGIMADRHNIDIIGTTIKVTKIMAAEPRRVSEIHVEFAMPKRTYTDKEKTLLEQAALTCPVSKSLHPDLKQVIVFNY